MIAAARVCCLALALLAVPHVARAVCTPPAAPGCGDGTNPDPAVEQCDHGTANGTPGDCCDACCRALPFLTPCLDDGIACTADLCDGGQFLGICTHNQQLPPETVCRPPVNECDVPETCPPFGTGAVTCPQDAFKPAETPCSQGVCDGRGGCCGDGIIQGAEQCDESSGSNGTTGSCCTANCRLLQAGSRCRERASSCDQAAVCDGASGACPPPPNPPAPSDTTCDDGDPCTRADHCDAGSCTGGTALCGAAATSLVRAANGNPAAIAVSCFGRRARRKASCLAFATVHAPAPVATNGGAAPATAFAFASGGGCRAANDGTILVSRKKRRALPKSGTVLVRLKLNSCVRKLYQELHPGETLPVDVTVMLDGVESDNQGSDSVTLRRILDIARGQ